VETSGLSQPPLHALAALRTHLCAPDLEDSRAFLRVLFPKLVAQHRHLAHSRDLGGGGLISICHPWESGLDNSPAWDRPLAALQLPPGPLLAGVPAAQRADRRRLRPLCLAGHDLQDAGYRDEHLRDVHPFAVEDPMVNAIYLASTHALWSSPRSSEPTRNHTVRPRHASTRG
jgi:hypothetical protein